MDSIQKISNETIMIENWISANKTEGDSILFQEIEDATSIKMDLKGRGYLRTALNRLRLEYEAIRGKGLRIACPANAVNIINNRIIKIDSQVKKGEKTYKNIFVSCYERLPEEDKKQVGFIGSVFGAIRAYSQNARTKIRSEIKNITHTELPRNISV